MASVFCRPSCTETCRHLDTAVSPSEGHTSVGFGLLKSTKIQASSGLLCMHTYDKFTETRFSQCQVKSSSSSSSLFPLYVGLVKADTRSSALLAKEEAGKTRPHGHARVFLCTNTNTSTCIRELSVRICIPRETSAG